MGTKRKFAASVLEDAKPHRRTRLNTQAEPEKFRLPTQDNMKTAPLTPQEVSDAAFVAIPRSPTVGKEPLDAALLETNHLETHAVEADVETDALETTPLETESIHANGEIEPVEVNATSVSISRPLEPTPDVHTLPVDESFCPSGFNMLEVLVNQPKICMIPLVKSTDD